MGQNPAAEYVSSGVRNSTANYKLRIASFKRCFSSIVFFVVFFAAPSNFFSQTNLETFTQIVERGNVEQKRDGLMQIRNLQTAEASRMAIPLLKDSSEIVRATAAVSVIYLSKDEALQNLLPLLADKKPLVRREAAYALGKVGNPSASNALIQTFQKDKVLEVKNAAIVALGEIGDASAIDLLIKILQKKPQSKEEFTRRSAARSIGQIAQIIQTGEAEVLTPEKFSSEKIKSSQSPKSSPQFVKTFPQFIPAIEILIRTLQDSREFPDVKREAAFALGAIGDESAIPVLQFNLNNEDYYFAEISRQALQKILASATKKTE